MPWTARDSKRHTRKANTPKKRRMWAHIAESMRKRGASEGSAIRAANARVRDQGGKEKSMARRGKKRGKKHGKKR